LSKHRFLAVILLLSLVLIIDIHVYYRRQFDDLVQVVNTRSDPAVIARGDYLVYGPGRCADCHGDPLQRDAIAAGEKVPLSGGFFEDIYLGEIYFPNITSDNKTGIGRLSDHELTRFMRTGINHRGEYGLPFMNYQSMTPSDLTAVISFLRSLEPVGHEVDPIRYNFLGKLALRYFIEPQERKPFFPDSIARGATVEYGRYLAEALGSCRECHTDRSLVTGAYRGEFYAGGMLFEHPENPELAVVSPGLLPKPGTGTIAGFTKDEFIKRMQAGSRLPWSPMPWGPFSRMTTGDLEAIYLYLASL
jgi:mono/diheme cytochrome c family protein